MRQSKNKQTKFMEFLQFLKSLNHKEMAATFSNRKRTQIASLDLCYSNLSAIIEVDFLPNLQTLKLQGNYISRIVTIPLTKSITYLSLGSNNIQTIEGIPTLDLPNLSTLKMYSNKMIQIKSLRKIKSRKLAQICLQDNQEVQNLMPLTLLPIKKQQVLKINIINDYDKLRTRKVVFLKGKANPLKIQFEY